MKRLFFMMSAAILLAACTPQDNAPAASIELATGQEAVITLESGGDIDVVRFTSSKEWRIEMSDDADWLEVSPLQGEAGSARVNVKAEINRSPEKRTALMNILSDDVTVPVSVEQDVYLPTLKLQEKEDGISCLGGNFTVKIAADVEYGYETDADWIKEADSRAVRNHEHEFVAEPNPYEYERTATITFSYENLSEVFTVIQRPAGTAADDWVYEDFKHRSLAMRFTADWCGYCPMMAKAFESAESSMGGRLELVSLHGSDSALEFASTNTYISRFRVSGFPTGVVDARASVRNYSDISVTAETVRKVAEESWENYPAKTGIAVSSTLSGNDLSMDVSIYVKEADSYRLTILLLEDGIVGYQNGEGNSYVHDHVARMTIASGSESAFRTTSDAEIKEMTYKVKVPEYCNPSNLRILVYVEKPYGDRDPVCGVSTADYGNFGDTYIDNCRSVEAGTDAPLELL